uniref:Retinol dehydrogenase 11 n=1 Tax=Caligus rogercresseyi TaxID=217165 RepID=C1BRG7_CALRO|nr:Retinol dehydrogenase 11 [Caligus rogercresseyi]
MLNSLSERIYLTGVGVWMSLKEQILDRHKALTAITSNPGQVVVITGGSRGIGFEAAKKLIQNECMVIVGCRKIEEAERKLKEIPNSEGKFKVFPLDLQSLDSVRAFAGSVRETAPDIHVLLNNAGIMMSPHFETKDGFESQSQTNYLSHFLLSSLLLDRIRSRIVNVSSVAHVMAHRSTNWEDLQMKELYTPEGGYSNSKADQIMFTKYLQSKIDESPNYKGKISVFALHPGVIYSDLYVHMPLGSVLKCLSGVLMKSQAQGGDTLIHAALSPELDGLGGSYTENSQVVSASTFVSDPANQKKLWDKTLEILGMDKFAPNLD